MEVAKQSDCLCGNCFYFNKEEGFSPYLGVGSCKLNKSENPTIHPLTESCVHLVIL